MNGIVKDVLECGHALQRRPEDGTGTYSRRCYRCRLGFPADGAESVRGERDRFAAALWDIRMTTERWTADTDPATFANVIIHKALSALGTFARAAQELNGAIGPDEPAEATAETDTSPAAAPADRPTLDALAEIDAQR